GVVLDVLVQSRRDKQAAKRLLRKLLKKQTRAPRVMVTDKLASYSAAKGEVMPSIEHRRHKGLNNRASLFGRLGSSAFRLSDRHSFSCPAGSCFSPESAPRPLHD